MIGFKDYQGKCWWCGDPADSREHKFKKTDVAREYGKGAIKAVKTIYSGELPEMRLDGASTKVGNTPREIIMPVQSAKDEKLKFGKVICQYCNNTRSQQFDYAYDEFSSFIRLDIDQLAGSNKLDLEQIFGEKWEEKKELVKKYYLKHICCSLADGRAEIYQEFIDYLWGRTGHLSKIEMKLGIDLGVYDFLKFMEGDSTTNSNSWFQKYPLSGEFSLTSRKYLFLEGGLNYHSIYLAYRIPSEQGYYCNLDNKVVPLEVFENQRFRELIAAQKLRI